MLMLMLMLRSVPLRPVRSFFQGNWNFRHNSRNQCTYVLHQKYIAKKTTTCSDYFCVWRLKEISLTLFWSYFRKLFSLGYCDARVIQRGNKPAILQKISPQYIHIWGHIFQYCILQYCILHIVYCTLQKISPQYISGGKAWPGQHGHLTHCKYDREKQ